MGTLHIISKRHINSASIFFNWWSQMEPKKEEIEKSREMKTEEPWYFTRM